MTAQEMFESMGFKKDKFDYFGLDRFIYKKPINQQCKELGWL